MEFEKDYLDWVKEVFQFYYIYLKEKEWEKTLMKHTPKESRLRKEYEECIKKVKEYYAEIKKNLEIDEERIQYMFQSFSKDSKCVEANIAGLSLLCYDELHEKSWDEYYEKIRSMTEKEKIETYITILENFEEELKEDEIPQDFNTFVLYLQNSQFDKEICWNILQVFMNQETYFEETVEIIKKTIRVMQLVGKKYLPYFLNKFEENWIRQYDNNSIMDYIQETLKLSWRKNPNGNRMVMSILFPVSFSIELKSDKKLITPDIIRIGCAYTKDLPFSEIKDTKESIRALGKILGDKSKLDIIECIGNEQAYGKELAKKLGLTTATISYHISSLVDEGLVIINVKSGRVYYQLNKEEFCERLERIKQYLNQL